MLRVVLYFEGVGVSSFNNPLRRRRTVAENVNAYHHIHGVNLQTLVENSMGHMASKKKITLFKSQCI